MLIVDSCSTIIIITIDKSIHYLPGSMILPKVAPSNFDNCQNAFRWLVDT